MKKTATAMLAALPLLLFGVPGHAAQAGEPTIYEGTVNHVGDDTILRVAYRGGQIRVKPRNLSETDLSLDELVGRKIRIRDAAWRDGYLEGRLEAYDGEPLAPSGG